DAPVDWAPARKGPPVSTATPPDARAGEAALIELRNVTRTFSTGKKSSVTAADDVSFTVNPGDVFGVIGFSGAGNSTLIRLINGLERPTSGSITVLGQDLTTHSEARLRHVRKRIGMVFQQFN